jgi:anti-sigma B factor antagonist
MRISSSVSEGGTVLHIHCQRLDAVVADELRAVLAEAVARSGAGTVDLAEVQFMDSSGLGALVAALRPAAPGICLSNVRPAVRTVLRLTRVDRAIRVIG